VAFGLLHRLLDTSPEAVLAMLATPAPERSLSDRSVCSYAFLRESPSAGGPDATSWLLVVLRDDTRLYSLIVRFWLEVYGFQHPHRAGEPRTATRLAALYPYHGVQRFRVRCLIAAAQPGEGAFATRMHHEVGQYALPPPVTGEEALEDIKMLSGAPGTEVSVFVSRADRMVRNHVLALPAAADARTPQTAPDADVVAFMLRKALVVLGDLDAASRETPSRLHPGIMVVLPSGGRYLNMHNAVVRAFFDVLCAAGVPPREVIKFAYNMAGM